MTTARLVSLAITIAILAPTLACATSAAPASTPAPERTEPPRMLTRGSFPELSISAGPNPAGRPVVRMRIEVRIDPLGRPDLKTLKVVGLGGAENRMAIERWLESATFRPAMRNGEPVSGTWQSSFEVRVSVRRF